MKQLRPAQKIPKLSTTHVKKILIIKAGAIGDVIFTTPFVAKLKEIFKDAEIDYFVGKWSKDPIINNPAINRVIFVDDNLFFGKGVRNKLALLRARRPLIKEKYDLVFVLDKTPLASWFARPIAKTRIGFARPHEPGLIGKLLPNMNTYNVQYRGVQHEILYYLDLLAPFGFTHENRDLKKDLLFRPKLYPDSKEEKHVDSYLKKTKFFEISQANGKEWIAICPAGGKNPGQTNAVNDYRLWPFGNYVKAAETLSERYNILLYGSPSEKESNTTFAISVKKNNAQAEIIDCTGEFNIRETSYLLKNVAFAITNDSGPLHIASTATKTVSIFGATDPVRFAPFWEGNTVVAGKLSCSPCYDIYGRYDPKCLERKCMNSVQPKDVLYSIGKNGKK
jgi:heptosyltransferase-2